MVARRWIYADSRIRSSRELSREVKGEGEGDVLAGMAFHVGTG